MLDQWTCHELIPPEKTTRRLDIYVLQVYIESSLSDCMYTTPSVYGVLVIVLHLYTECIVYTIDSSLSRRILYEGARLTDGNDAAADYPLAAFPRN